jgi:hypothetical protein
VIFFEISAIFQSRSEVGPFGSQATKIEIMNTNEKLIELRNLQSRADVIRRDLGISLPGTVTFMSAPAGSNDCLIVEADGFGGATMRLVEGNYPLDYVTKSEKAFPTEKDAESAAELGTLNALKGCLI